MTSARGTDERGVAAVLILFALMLSALATAPASWAVPLPGIASAGFLILMKRRWRHLLPCGGVPWYRLVVLSLVLMLALLAVDASDTTVAAARLSSPPDSLPHPLRAIAVAPLLVIIAIFYELLLRGVVYSNFDRRSGAAWAVFGSTFVSLFLIVAANGVTASVLLAGLMTSLLLAGSRWLTRSVTPALVVHGAFGAFGALFMLLIGAS